MSKPRWLRILAGFVLSSALFVGLLVTGLTLTDRYLVMNRSGGDQTQSSPVDLTPHEPAAPLPTFAAEEVRNVILIIGDGMGFSHMVAARSELAKMNQRLFIERFPWTGWQTTHSLESVYTDSAASASSIATGYKVPYGGISVDGLGRPRRTIAEASLERGMAVGLVTDSYLWDATMAAFLSHAESRREFRQIASHMAESGALVVAGEQHPRLLEPNESGSSEAAEIVATFERNGFEVAHSAADLERLATQSTKPVLGLFDSSSVADPDQEPDLVDLAGFALDRLRQNEDGFFLVVESEEADSGGHGRDLSRIVRGIRSINEVAEIAVEYALVDRTTLVLVTADHETGGLDILHGDDEHTLGIRWSTSSHSAEPVPIYAFGAAAERFSGVKDNTEIARTLSEILGLGMFD